MQNLNEVAAKALALFRDKLSGQVIDEKKFYEMRKELAWRATAGLPYQLESFGNLMLHAQHWIDQAKPPLTEAEQARLYSRLEQWVEMRLQEAAKAGAPRVADPNTAARGAVAASGSGMRKGKVKL